MISPHTRDIIGRLLSLAHPSIIQTAQIPRRYFHCRERHDPLARKVQVRRAVAAILLRVGVGWLPPAPVLTGAAPGSFSRPPCRVQGRRAFLPWRKEAPGVQAQRLLEEPWVPPRREGCRSSPARSVGAPGAGGGGRGHVVGRNSRATTPADSAPGSWSGLVQGTQGGTWGGNGHGVAVVVCRGVRGIVLAPRECSPRHPMGEEPSRSESTLLPKSRTGGQQPLVLTYLVLDRREVKARESRGTVPVPPQRAVREERSVLNDLGLGQACCVLHSIVMVQKILPTTNHHH